MSFLYLNSLQKETIKLINKNIFCAVKEFSSEIKLEQLNINNIWIEKLSPIFSQIPSTLPNPVLICGNESTIHTQADFFQQKNYLTMDEYCSLFPYLVPISKRPVVSQQLVSQIQKRLSIQSIDHPLQISNILVLQKPTRWEEHCQIICDLITTIDGKIAKNFDLRPTKHIPIIFNNNNEDLIYLESSIKECYKLIYEAEVQPLIQKVNDQTIQDSLENHLRMFKKDKQLNNIQYLYFDQLDQNHLKLLYNIFDQVEIKKI